MVGVDDVGQRRRLRQDAQPAERIHLFELAQHVWRDGLARHAVEAVATGDEVAVHAHGLAAVLECDVGPIGGHIHRLIELNPRDRTAQSMAGVLAFESGDCASAAAHFEAGREESTTNPEASALYGDCLVKLRRAPEAVTVFERLWRQGDPPNTAVLRSLASAQAAAGTPELAASTLARALEIVREEQSYVDLAALCIVNNAPQRALASIEAGLAEWPRSARLYSLRGVVEAEGGKPADAERDFGFANQLDPKGQYGSAGLGVLYTDTGRAEEASAVLRQRLQKEPSDATLSYLLAQALTREGAAPGSSEFREAQEALVKATRTRPGFVAAHTALGKLLRQSGDEARALAEFELALKLDGSDRTALNQLAALLRRAGRVQEAEQAAATLRELVVGSGAKD